MSRPEEFLDWLEEQDGNYIQADKVEDQFPDLIFDFSGITVKLDDDGNALVPKRDYRDAIIHGQPLD